MERQQSPSDPNIIDSLKRRIRLLTITSVLLLIVSIGLGYLWLKLKAKFPSKTILSGIVTQTEEDAMVNAFETDVSQNGYKTGVKGQQGIYHHIDTLISQLNKWKYGLGIDSVDLRFCEGVAGVKDPGKFSVLMIPLRLKSGVWPRTRYPHDGTSKTQAVDLGDLHP